MIRNSYLIGSKNEAFGPGGIQNAITETLVRTEGPIDAKLIDKTVSENGVYKAKDDGADGYSSVTVDIPQDYNAKFEKTAGISTGLFTIENSLTEIIIPEGVKILAAKAFQYMNFLQKVVIPEGVTIIGSSCFDNCIRLTDIMLPNSLNIIQSNAFAYCALKSIVIPSSVTSIDTSAFNETNLLTTITINKPEGSIPGAPWGATNAEVIWNG